MKHEKVISFGILTLIFMSICGIILLVVQNKNISSLVNHEKTPKIGDNAFIFKRTDLYGQTIDIRGKTTLLIFFDTTCDKCRKGSDKWNKFYKTSDSEKINIVGISTEINEVTKKFTKKYNIAFPIISDPNHEILWKYKVKSVPLLVLVNQNGSILYYKHYTISSEKALKEISLIIRDSSTTKFL